MAKIIHNKGPKVDRDRELLTKFYDSMCRAFPWYTPEPIDKLNNFQLNALCKRVWAEQDVKDHNTYMQLLHDKPEIVVEAPEPVKYRNMIVPQELVAEGV